MVCAGDMKKYKKNNYNRVHIGKSHTDAMCRILNIYTGIHKAFEVSLTNLRNKFQCCTVYKCKHAHLCTEERNENFAYSNCVLSY